MSAWVSSCWTRRGGNGSLNWIYLNRDSSKTKDRVLWFLTLIPENQKVNLLGKKILHCCFSASLLLSWFFYFHLLWCAFKELFSCKWDDSTDSTLACSVAFVGSGGQPPLQQREVLLHMLAKYVHVCVVWLDKWGHGFCKRGKGGKRQIERDVVHFEFCHPCWCASIYQSLPVLGSEKVPKVESGQLWHHKQAFSFLSWDRVNEHWQPWWSRVLRNND